MKIFVAGLSFKSAPVAVREKLAVAAKAAACHGCRVKVGAGLDEVVVLSTCNRVEIYGAASKVNGNVHGIFRHWGATDQDVAPYLYVKEGGEAAEHLFSVTSGLDSMVLGETEITGQVKNAYSTAKEAKLTGRMTNRWFQTAMQVAKEIRTRTSIGRGAVSVGSVAVELAEKIFEQGLAGKTVMIIGAGKMGEACVRHLMKKGAKSVLVVNRSQEKAAALAAEVGEGATGMGMDNLLTAMEQTDIVVSSTGAAQTILSRADVEQVMAARRGRPLFLIDIAVPRDIAEAVQEIPGVYLYNIDDLQEIMRENTRQREQGLTESRAIIAKHSVALLARFQPERKAEPEQTRKNFDGVNREAGRLSLLGFVESASFG